MFQSPLSRGTTPDGIGLPCNPMANIPMFQSPLSRGTTPDDSDISGLIIKIVSIPSKSGHYSRRVSLRPQLLPKARFQSPLSRGTTPDQG